MLAHRSYIRLPCLVRITSAAFPGSQGRGLPEPTRMHLEVAAPDCRRPVKCVCLFSAITASTSVRRRFFGALDHENIHIASACFQLKAKLLLKGCKQRWSVL
jgi:hypothetical protein